ncbi:MAG: hypothetical protein GAK31_03148 [Stenotrophomonas maltophilia]|uniref:Uncharacterized protein n=1 Tax=Stenotrophomonas maltophilia TaxID=40324 RepID=A0A7V8FEY8_STEMA|nr:MAG: hypothetical protein GAK31_03148 [Stenotrophomonas maltophilia]
MSIHRPLLSLLLAAGAALLLALPARAQNAYFFPHAAAADAAAFDPAIPTPEQFLGYPIGSRYTRHDQLVAYFQALAQHSDRISVQ